MSLRFRNRIALFNTIAVAATTALVFVVIYWVVRTTAYAHLDADIVQEKEEVSAKITVRGDSIFYQEMSEAYEAEHNHVEVNPTFFQIVDVAGRIVSHSPNLRKEEFLYNPSNARGTYYNSEINGQKIRLGQYPIFNAQSVIVGQLTIAISQQESFAILNNLLLVLLIAFPLVLIAQFVASSFAAAGGIAPVNRLIHMASKISDSTIGTRLELPARKDELFELTRTINELLMRIEASLQQQKQFTSDASHEIRTPLAAIRGTLEVLVRKQREPAVYEEKIAVILAQVDRIDLLLEQLLQLARIETGVVIAKRDSMSLLPIAMALAGKWRETAKGKSIHIEIEIPETAVVVCDKLYLEMILDNLVHNAIKYGREQGKVNLRWSEASKSLMVVDNGIGIAATQLSQIFNRFFRADASRGSAVGGSGLGLSIAKKLADLQHIALSASSIEGEGSTFTLQFER